MPNDRTEMKKEKSDLTSRKKGDMEDYPEELRTPPVSLVSIVGFPELHATISGYLHSEQPPVNTLALPDFSKISVLAGKQREGGDSGRPAAGILKREWLGKHRTRVPAVSAAMFGAEQVSGDPAQWLQVCTDLENLKAVIRGKNIKLIVVLVQSTSKGAEMSNADDISEDRIVALKKRAEIDSKHLLTFVWNDAIELKQSLNRLASIFAELSNVYYREEGRRIKTRIEKKNFSSIEMHIRYCFKARVAVYAEFRRDWVEALRSYEEAYHVLREMVGVSKRLPPIQRLIEIKAVAEQLHFKIAAKFLRQKRYYLELSLSQLESSKKLPGANANESSSESVIPSVYVGQFARLLEQEDGFSMQPLTDADYVRYALEEGKRFQDSYEIIALLKKSLESYNNLKAQRMTSYCAELMGREYFIAGDFSNAKLLFEGILVLYRKEGWATLLWGILDYLRECSRKLSLTRDFVEYSLEMAALPILYGSGMAAADRKEEYGPAGPPSLLQRECIQKEVFVVFNGEPLPKPSEGSASLSVTEDAPLRLDIDHVSPLRAAFLASAAFHEQAVKPSAPTLLTISLLTQLPHPVEIDQLEIQFNQSECNFTIVSEQKLHMEQTSVQEHGFRLESAPDLILVSNKWLRLMYEVKSGQTGKLECLSVVIKIGRHSMICCLAESPASMEDLPLWKFEAQAETFPTKDPSLSFSGQKFIQIEEPDPQVDLLLGACGPALVGEDFVVPVTITSKGHKVLCGELKINLVDTRGGGLISPREHDSFAFDNLHVELLSISGSTHEDKVLHDADDIKKIQQSFGLVAIPTLNIGESWSGKLEIRWHRPKPVMLYVSLGYSPTSSDANAPKVHVHKSLQIEGKIPVTINHRFMMPFRHEPLLLSNVKHNTDPDSLLSLALNETSILIVSVRNCTEVPLRLISISIETDDNDTASQCAVRCSGSSSTEFSLLAPGEEYKRVFSVTPEVSSPKISMGTVCLSWVRDSEARQLLHSESDIKVTGFLMRHKLPDVKAEKPPLIVILECPPHAIVGVPFSCYLKVRNRTNLLQEIKYSLVDSSSFVSSGPHNGAAFILPDSEHILSYKLVPLTSGQQQLPRISVMAVRYSAGLNPSPSAYTLFVFPCEPHFEANTEEAVKEPGPISAA
ncbi:hypothetical protein ACLOJK_015656 [Asimina triloba]